MCRIVHPFACKTKIKRKSSHDHYLSGRKIFNMTSAPDHSIDHCTHHSKHCTGCTCRNCKIRTVQFQEQTQQISTHSSQKIDQQIFQFSNCTLQSASKHKQYQHVISKMLRSKMKEHTCKDPIVFSLHNGGSICRSALKHMHGIL